MPQSKFRTNIKPNTGTMYYVRVHVWWIGRWWTIKVQYSQDWHSEMWMMNNNKWRVFTPSHVLAPPPVISTSQSSWRMYKIDCSPNHYQLFCQLQPCQVSIKVTEPIYLNCILSHAPQLLILSLLWRIVYWY